MADQILTPKEMRARVDTAVNSYFAEQKEPVQKDLDDLRKAQEASVHMNDGYGPQGNSSLRDVLALDNMNRAVSDVATLKILNEDAPVLRKAAERIVGRSAGSDNNAVDSLVGKILDDYTKQGLSFVVNEANTSNLQTPLEISGHPQQKNGQHK